MKHLEQPELANITSQAEAQVAVGARYMHYKQLQYKVLAVALRTEDCEPCVVYQAEYGARTVWTRPLSSWLEELDIDGNKTPRFKKVET